MAPEEAQHAAFAIATGEMKTFGDSIEGKQIAQTHACPPSDRSHDEEAAEHRSSATLPYVQVDWISRADRRNDQALAATDGATSATRSWTILAESASCGMLRKTLVSSFAAIICALHTMPSMVSARICAA
jgi:hypothetical protein